MRVKLIALCFVGAVVAAAGCSQKVEQPAAAPAAAPTSAKPKLGVKPFGTADPNFKPDYSKLPPELQKTFTYIDEHIDEHVENLQRWMRQPSISNSGEGIPESAEMVKGFFEQMGCQDARVIETGITEYGSPANPSCTPSATRARRRRVAIYWMYDTMPVTQPDNWIAPPFEARIVDGQTAVAPQASRVIIARGATNSKGGEMAELNALTAMKAALGKLPVNIMWVAEGDEERMDIGLRKFIADHSDLLQEADALLSGGPSEGCVYVELTTSGKAWGRGPTISDIHGSNMRTVDSVGWRHMHMLASLTSEDGNTPLIKGFFDNKELPTPADVARMKEQAKSMDLAQQAQILGVARYKWDDPYMVIKGRSFETSFNLDGIWGGNMYAGGAGAIMPNKITSKHNFRYVPRMDGLDIVKKLRAQIDANGYKDVDVKLIGDVPWSRGSSRDTDITRGGDKAAADVASTGLVSGSAPAAPNTPPPAPGTVPRTSAAATNSDSFTTAHRADPALSGGYWPSYLFADGEVGQKIGSVSIPMGMGSVGGAGGGRAHAANEFYTIEAIGKTGGMAYDEKGVAATIWEYSQLTTNPPKPKTHVAK